MNQQEPLSPWDAELDREEQEKEEKYFQQWRQKIKKEKKKNKIQKVKETGEKKADKLVSKGIKRSIYALLADPITFLPGVIAFDLYAIASLFSSHLKLNYFDILLLGFVNLIAFTIILVILAVINITVQIAQHPTKTTWEVIIGTIKNLF